MECLLAYLAAHGNALRGVCGNLVILDSITGVTDDHGDWDNVPVLALFPLGSICP